MIPQSANNGSRPIVVGIVGGIASGKSAVSRQLQELGALRVDADKIGHGVLNDPEVVSLLTDRWGKSILGEGKYVDRREVASIVFGDKAGELTFLESITHPRIGQIVSQQIKKAFQDGIPVVVLDAALLFEASWDEFCDQILFIDVPHEIRLQRAAQRGWTEAEFTRREESQLSIEEKKRRSDVVIDNSGQLKETQEQVRAFWGTITASRDRKSSSI